LNERERERGFQTNERSRTNKIGLERKRGLKRKKSREKRKKDFELKPAGVQRKREDYKPKSPAHPTR
jgi:hypothetical protein